MLQRGGGATGVLRRVAWFCAFSRYALDYFAGLRERWYACVRQCIASFVVAVQNTMISSFSEHSTQHQRYGGL